MNLLGIGPLPTVDTTNSCIRSSVTSTEERWNRILDSNVNALCQCPHVADENREAMRATSMMRDCNASALTPARKSSIAVLSPRHFLHTSPLSFSTVGFLHGITDFSARTPSSNGVQFGKGCRNRFAACRLPASFDRGSNAGLTGEQVIAEYNSLFAIPDHSCREMR